MILQVLPGTQGLYGFVALFIVLPTLATSALLHFFPDAPMWVRNLLEGVVKLVIFFLYLYLCSKMKDIHRTFQYHGAEHKSIACYESGLELTVENVKKMTRFHPRCGTSFIFVMLIFSVIFYSILAKCFPVIATQRVLWMLLKLVFLPILMGLGYEFIRYAGKHDNLFVKIVSAPGLWMQRLTTREPDDSMMEVGIAALKAVITDNPEDDEIK